LTEKSTASSSERETVFENEFAFITHEGEVKLKKNKLFEERTIATIDPESAEEQIKSLEQAFEDFKKRIETFISRAKTELSEQPDNVEEQFELLLNEITSGNAVGDFEGLVSEAMKSFEKLKKGVVTDESESVDTVAAEDGTVNVESVESASADEISNTESADEADNPIEKADTAAEDSTEENDHGIKISSVDETEVTENGSEEIVKASETGEAGAEEPDETPESFYNALLEKAEEIVKLDDWAYISMEFDNIDNQWEEGPEAGDADIKPIRKKIDELRDAFETKKRDHYEEQKKLRLENLEKKKDLLRQLGEIIDNNEWTKTREVGKIKGRWEHLKPLPSGEAEKLQPRFDTLLATFDEHKVDRLVKQKQQEEDNLTGKLVIVEKMEGFVDHLDDKSDWEELDKKFNDLTRQFRKIGRVPADKNQEIWDRYHSAQDSFHSMRFKHDASYRNEIEKFLTQKKKLIDEAEALIDSDDLADAARKVNKLHRRWKKVGNLPQKDENEMWDRFKAATDAFNQKKTDNADLLKKQEDENYDQKLKLIEEANELKESEEWDEAHKQFQKLMDKWKEVGPVPKRKSGKIWKKFKGAMDYFYDRRRDHYKEVKEERKDNLKEKEEVLAKLSELTKHDDPIEAVELAKPLQEEFKKAGYVPIKHKNRLWKEYRELCDVIYDRFRAAKAAVDVVGRQNLDQFSADDIADIRDKQNEANKLRKQISKLNSELIQMTESLSYFKPSGSGSSLLDDVKKRIDKAEKDLEKKESRLADLDKEIDMLKNEVG
jgi:hypothetical protein